jgi:tetratricopeptide (TPR) repeat protein
MAGSLVRNFAIAAMSVGLAAAQQQGGPTPPAGGPTGPGGGAPGGRGNIPNNNPPINTPTPGQQRTPFPEMQRPIFLSGKVMLNEGTPPPEPVVIERVCGSRVIQEGWTDSKGRFSFELGRNREMMADASSPSGGFPGGPGMGGGPNSTRGGLGGDMGGSSSQERNLFGCELRAALPGFRSDNVNLSSHRSLDNPDVGTIVLHRLANVEGLTISATTYAAPKDAKKAFDKGRDAAKKHKLEDAEKQLGKAVELYPKYAVAWYELGRVHEAENRLDDARKDYAEALKADSKLISPYERMAALAMQDRKWQEAADITDRMIRLNPVDFPTAYFYNAVANLNLQQIDAAEKSASELLKVDTQHHIPKAEHLMAVILAQKHDFEAAVPHFRAFLGLVPAGADADLAKKQLAEIEKTLAAKKE